MQLLRFRRPRSLSDSIDLSNDSMSRSRRVGIYQSGLKENPEQIGIPTHILRGESAPKVAATCKLLLENDLYREFE
jgi:hypothetical protein